jgi:hypothetical protein
VGFTIATIVFSVLNYASTGYTLQAAYLSDPQPKSWPGMDSWYKHWPASLVGRNQPSCQPASIPISSALFTNNTALSWTVDAVGLSPNSTTKAMPSLIYQGEELTNCELTMITISAYVVAEPGHPTRFTSMWQTKVQGKVYCRVYTASLGSIQLNLTSTVSFRDYEIDGGRLSVRTRHFLDRDETYFSLLRAESLLWGSYRKLARPLLVISGDLPEDNNYTGVSTSFVRDFEFTAYSFGKT